MDPGGWRRGPQRSHLTKIMKESVKTGHPTGLPEKLLRLFAPGQPLRHIPENCKPRKPPAVGWTGVGQYLEQFAKPGDDEYEPEGGSATFTEARLFHNKEYGLQVRLDTETKREK
jgi:U1 small nuclear ribonucleoprotein